jgi:hypothetical protein
LLVLISKDIEERDGSLEENPAARRFDAPVFVFPDAIDHAANSRQLRCLSGSNQTLGAETRQLIVVGVVSLSIKEYRRDALRERGGSPVVSDLERDRWVDCTNGAGGVVVHGKTLQSAGDIVLLDNGIKVGAFQVDQRSLGNVSGFLRSVGSNMSEARLRAGYPREHDRERRDKDCRDSRDGAVVLVNRLTNPDEKAPKPSEQSDFLAGFMVVLAAIVAAAWAGWLIGRPA